MKTLPEWLRWQEQQHPRAIDLGLARVAQVWQALGAPRLPRTVTVAGTNGKGTAVYALDALARAGGWSVGRYTSPHLHDYRERVVMDGMKVDEERLCLAFARIAEAAGSQSLTFFEYGTLAALLIFAESQLDLVVLEVGLGGRLDATNLVDADIAILCSIARDHTDWLGDTLEAIAGEKAGIARRGRLALVAAPSSAALYQPHLDRIGAITRVAGNDFPAEFPHGATVLAQESLAVAWEAWQQLGPHTTAVAPEVLANLRIPGRLERRAAPWGEYLLDVAHNPAAARRLRDVVRSWPAWPTLLVFGVQADKDIAG
ncbi:MAG: Mur ligase family protein, partial [Oceanococcaceae bacterium]